MDYKQLYEKAISIQIKALNEIYKDIKEYAFVFVYPQREVLPICILILLLFSHIIPTKVLGRYSILQKVITCFP